MAPHRTRTRHLALVALALMLGLIGAPAVAAADPLPPPQPRYAKVIPAWEFPTFTKVRAWRSAGGRIDFQVEVTNAATVDLDIEGTVALVAHDTYSWGDVYRFRATGLVPGAAYTYRVTAISPQHRSAVYNGSIVA